MNRKENKREHRSSTTKSAKSELNKQFLNAHTFASFFFTFSIESHKSHFHSLCVWTIATAFPLTPTNHLPLTTSHSRNPNLPSTFPALHLHLLSLKQKTSSLRLTQLVDITSCKIIYSLSAPYATQLPTQDKL